MANNEQLNVLKQHFPNCFDKNGAFIPDKLQAIVEENGVKVSTEGYSLNWLGKSYARLLTNEAPRTLLKADTTHNAQPGNTNSQNLLIKGDNLEVLKHLKGAYSRQVKMIYIDPPYNTGSDGFVYADDRQFSAEQLSHLAGIELEEAQRVLDFTSSKSNSHSAWLTFMYPRLYIARDLLRDDGVIFISIDDNEQAQLKILCDEVFGEENFVGTFVWRRRASSALAERLVSTDHEYVLAYQRTSFIALGIRKDFENYSNTDNDLRGAWVAGDLTVGMNKDLRPNQFYPLVNPKTGKSYPPNPNRVWAYISESMNKLIAEERVIFPDDISRRPMLKRFKNELKSNVNPLSTWLTEVGLNTESTKELQDLFGQSPFNYSKPSSLLKHLLSGVMEKKEIVLDFFAGSATTAKAVMQLNAEDGGNRQFICVQLPEATDVKSEAYKAGYHTIFDIAHARITKAAAKIKAEYPDCNGDLGFKVFETVPVFEGYMDEPEELTVNLELFNGDALTEQDRFNLLLTWAAQDGISLTSELTPVELAGYIAYQGGEAGRLLYFIHPKLSLDVVVELLRRLDDDAKFAPKHLVVWGYGLDSKEQREMSEAIAHHNKSNRKGIELDLEVRF
jgi:adenine-specific DNA-methyltransferase